MQLSIALALLSSSALATSLPGPHMVRAHPDGGLMIDLGRSTNIKNKEMCGPGANNGMEWDESIKSCVCQPEMNVRLVRGGTITTACLKECPPNHYSLPPLKRVIQIPACKKCGIESSFTKGCDVCSSGFYQKPTLHHSFYDYQPLESEEDCTKCSYSTTNYGTLEQHNWESRALELHDNKDWKQLTKGRSCFCYEKSSKFNPFTSRCEPVVCEGDQAFDESTGECETVKDPEILEDIKRQRKFLHDHSL